MSTTKALAKPGLRYLLPGTSSSEKLSSFATPVDEVGSRCRWIATSGQP
jgi:hypothetical protein